MLSKLFMARFRIVKKRKLGKQMGDRDIGLCLFLSIPMQAYIIDNSLNINIDNRICVATQTFIHHLPQMHHVFLFCDFLISSETTFSNYIFLFLSVSISIYLPIHI